MITKEEARAKAIEYLKVRNREYVEVAEEDNIFLRADEKVLYGDRKGEIIDLYSVEYTVEWGLDYMGMYIKIDADSGDVLYTMSPTLWIEEWEEIQED